MKITDQNSSKRKIGDLRIIQTINIFNIIKQEI